MRIFDPLKYYLFIETASSILYSLAFTAMSLYEVQVANLTPLQLVLVGTALELSVLVCEVPTGIVADVYSRRLSIIIGLCLIGSGFLIEGLLPLFAIIILAQVMWGLGYTFTSGSRQAWLSDEIGESLANKTFLTANKYSLAGSLAGMLLAILTGRRLINLPILISGVLFVVLAAILAFSMSEHGFHPTPAEDRNSFKHIFRTLHLGIQTVRERPRLISILEMGFFYGLYSEGFDRLWVKHLLASFTLPELFGSTDIAFFGILRGLSMILAIGSTALVERHVDTSQPRSISRSIFGITAGISISIFLFAWSPILSIALASYLAISTLRNLIGPLVDAWVNQRLDSDVRATILSMTGQADAVGQISGGPLIGLLANLISVPTAIAVSGSLLIPALPIILRANKKDTPIENLERL
jgi:DHA3 family tetracycline resistance protein-like MFS transporter